jgi:hypothetical protein
MEVPLASRIQAECSTAVNDHRAMKSPQPEGTGG